MAYKAIRLDSGGGLAATFVPVAGMVGVSLVHEGGEYLDQRDGIAAYIENASTMGLPILYPWANRLARDSWKFAGQAVMIDPDSYQVKRDKNGYPIHGTLAASSLWRVEEAETDENMSTATLRATLDFNEHPRLLQTFPFPHRLELEYRVTGGELQVTTTVTPTGDLPVPLAYGFHPYLTLPGSNREDWRVGLPEMIRLETDRRQIPTGNTHLDRASEEPLGDRDLDDAYSGVADGAEFSVADGQTAIRLRLDRGYRAAQVYSPRGRDFICFEPMKSPVNALVTGRDLTSVQPGDQDVAGFSIRIGPDEGEEPSGEVDVRAPSFAVPAAQTEAPTTVGTPVGDRRYRLDPAGDPVDEVRRVASGRTDSALSCLRQSDPDDRAKAVHTARKDMKKLRALLRLVRDELGKKVYRTENRRFRDAARKLSDARDAEVLAGTVDSLTGRYPENGPPLDGLREELQQRRESAAGRSADDSVDAHLKQAAEEIARGEEAIADWPLETSGWGLFEPGLRRCYGDGRKALQAVTKNPPPAVMHELRKRVKDLWYDLRLLRDGWPEGLAGPTAEAESLSELLGDYNDLSVLLSEIDARDVEGEDLSLLAEVARDRQSELLEAALPGARRLFAEKPSAFTGRLGIYWSA